jgi:hypothetical protein
MVYDDESKVLVGSKMMTAGVVCVGCDVGRVGVGVDCDDGFDDGQLVGLVCDEDGTDD